MSDNKSSYLARSIISMASPEQVRRQLEIVRESFIARYGVEPEKVEYWQTMRLVVAGPVPEESPNEA